ncbi:hypothetical protein D3C77_334230 [compost metagenome]
MEFEKAAACKVQTAASTCCLAFFKMSFTKGTLYRSKAFLFLENIMITKLKDVILKIHFEPRSTPFIRSRAMKSSTGRLVLPISPITSAPICIKNTMTQITTKVTQFALANAAVDWIIARTPKNAAIPYIINTV